jgi:hypothetical protein
MILRTDAVHEGAKFTRTRQPIFPQFRPTPPNSVGLGLS